MKVKSRVYSNQSLKFGKGVVKFVNGEAEVSEELYQEIVDRKFPNIFKEGEEPEYRTKFEEQLRKDVKDGNKEFEDEIKRLKNIVEAQKSEINRKDGEIVSWKKVVEDLKHEIEVFKLTLNKSSEKTETKVEEKTAESEEISEIRKDLEGMKVAELKALAMEEDYGNFEEADLKDKKKEEIINMILSKVG